MRVKLRQGRGLGGNLAGLLVDSREHSPLMCAKNKEYSAKRGYKQFIRQPKRGV